MEILIGYLDDSIDPTPPPHPPLLLLEYNLQLRVQSCFEEMSQYFVMFISDVDECQDATPCGANEQCSNEQGSYSCICRLGYRRQNNVCVKKGECSKVSYQQLTSEFHASALLSITNCPVTLSK